MDIDEINIREFSHGSLHIVIGDITNSKGTRSSKSFLITFCTVRDDEITIVLNVGYFPEVDHI